MYNTVNRKTAIATGVAWQVTIRSFVYIIIICIAGEGGKKQYYTVRRTIIDRRRRRRCANKK